jgi:hypothetical protein
MESLGSIARKLGVLAPRRRKMEKDESMELADLGVKGKVFCLSMQRSGTSSVGDFLEQWGLKRIGHQLSRENGWSRHWFNGNFEGIFSSKTFEEHEVYEDDPFWFPDFYKFIYHRVPDSRFILLYRDSDSWFKSMVRHSNGYTLGQTDIHAKIYRREDDLRWLEGNIAEFAGGAPRAMVLYDKAAEYKAIYERHIAEVHAFFAGPRAASLYTAKLGAPDVWPGIKQWLGLPEKEGVLMDVHTHKAKWEFTRSHLLKTKNETGGAR